MQGIAPVYSDKYLKYGVQIGTLKNPDFLKEQVRRVLALKNQIFRSVYKKQEIDEEEVFKWVFYYGERLGPFIEDTIELFDKAIKESREILLEAQLGSLRDIHYGIYPFTTSSSTLAGFGSVGAGIFSKEPPIVIGVVKAFSTSIGEGPFVTEMEKGPADIFRKISGEFGATTGRPRRIGYFDAVASRFGAKIQCTDKIALTKLDCLSGQKKLKICTKYIIDNREIDYFPLTSDLIKARPKYIEVDGWDGDISGIRDYERLPKEALFYIETIEGLLDKPIKYISVGPQREALIIR